MCARPAPLRRARGQSLVEFALVLPLLLLLTLIALDFGRVYLGWINLQNLTRIAANFAANNPQAWLTGDTATITRYQNQIAADASATNCTLTPTTPASPTFSDTNGDGVATGLGDHATVTLTCHFAVITPVISSIVGGTVAVTASSVFPVKEGLSGEVEAVDTCIAPTAAINANPPDGVTPLTVKFTDASGGGVSDRWAWDFGDGTTSNVRDPGDHLYTDAPRSYVVKYTVGNVCGESTTETTVTVAATSATPQMCVVPNYVQNHTRYNDAPPIWRAAGFTTTIIQGPGHPQGNYKITFQSLTAGTSVDCGATLVVNG